MARAVLREPLVHFVLLAGVLFGVSALLRGGDVIDVSREELDWRVQQIEADRGRSLTDEERTLVEEAYLDERVLVREALAEGLDDDERVDQILVQKMLHVLSADVIQPTDDELAAYYALNRERYATEEAVTIDEIVVAADAGLPAALAAGAEPDALPEGTLIAGRVMRRLTYSDLAQIFDEEAADLIFPGGTGAWVDAYHSVRGDHWTRVRERFPAEVPSLEVARDVVRADWIAEQEERRLLSRVAELRARYDVFVEGERR